MTEESTILKVKRKTLRTAITTLIKRLEFELSKPEVTDTELEEILIRLNEKSEELKSVDSDLESYFTEEVLETELVNTYEYRDKIVLWKHRTEKKIRELNRDSANSTAFIANNIERITNEHVSPNQNGSNVKLPELSISKFFGDASQWLTFWNSFKSAIHDNDKLDNISKFNYLKAHLGGIALNAIQGFAITNENYNISVEILEERFGRKDVLINTHMNNILKMQPLKSSNDIIQFRKYFDYCTTQIRSLESLGISSDCFGSLLCPLILKNLPSDLVLQYNQSEDLEKNNYNLTDLMAFLSKVLIATERTSAVSMTHQMRYPLPERSRFVKENIKIEKPSAAHLFSQTVKENNNKTVCIFCESSSHESSVCKIAYDLSLEERKGILRKKGGCYRCLKIKHIFSGCKAKVRCNICNGRHVSLMCFSKQDKSAVESQNSQHYNVHKSNELLENSTLTNQSCTKEVYLQTLIVSIQGKCSKYFVRAIYDSGSQKSYISTFAVNVLNLESNGEEVITHGLFGGIKTSTKHKRYKIDLSSVDTKYHCQIEVMDQERICAPIPKIRNKLLSDELKVKGIFVSDISTEVNSYLFEEDPDEIHLLLGADFAGKLLTGNIVHLSSGLVAVQTQLGWTVMGKYLNDQVVDSSLMVLSLHVNEAKLNDLWNLDSLGIKDPTEKLSKMEAHDLARKHFNTTVSRDHEGRYVVAIPWLEGHPHLPDHRALAENRLKSTVRNLKASNKLMDYEQVFIEWESEKIIEPIEIHEQLENSFVHYLPHRAVIKENSTTKIRPVFDGSAHTQGSVSINDCIEKGPNLIELIPSILNRFRTGKIGVVSDIRKAFLQIALRDQDKNFLRFLWWKEGNPENIILYRHCRVVFGISCSPFLLAATIAYHLDQAPNHLKEVAQKLQSSMYVDNCVTSVDSVEELAYFRAESKKLLESAKFDLRGWRNSHFVEEQEICFPDEKAEDETCLVPVLGLVWNTKEDSLSCDIRDMHVEEPITKRKILSLTHRVFDPIGFTCPITLIPKLLLQECWKIKVGWDTKLPENIVKPFEKWKDQILDLVNLKIPRRLSELPIRAGNTSFHVFCDACKTSYATCIFLRVEYNDLVTCQLVQARSRVAPIKSVTIPKLELLACTIGARLAQTVKNDLGMENIEIFYWTDSMDSLYWIKTEGAWTVFVANRCREIRSLSPTSSWNFVPGNKNPADLPSRGCSLKTLIKKRWYEGPLWLKGPRETWPSIEVNPNPDVINAEKRKIVVSAISNENPVDFYNRISFYPKIIRISGWLIRFSENSRKDKNNRISGDLSSEELKRAEHLILKRVQSDSFSHQNKEKLNSLPIIEDSNGLMRVKSKVLMREDETNFRLPIVLPSEHHVVKALIIWKHKECGHSGVQSLMTILREDYWILKSRKTIKKIINTCVTCKRFRVQPPKIIEGTLPEDRVRNAAVFEIIGVDLAGPLFLKDQSKVWILILTCAVYRAIHFELLTALSTDNFLLGLRRFISRRGRPSIIYSDNAKNFTGTNNLLKKVNWKRLKSLPDLSPIIWKFIPPSAPWWGGFWERLIGILKRMLRKVLGKSSLNYEEMSTTICDCEAIINSRPLTYVSEDVDDLLPLTPSMFLQEIRPIGVPDLDNLDGKIAKKRFEYRKRIRENLRSRFRLEYLGQLRQASNQQKGSTEIKIGDVVLIWTEKANRLDWPLGRILETYPSRDGLTRKAKVKTGSGILIRPLQKLCPLELEDYP